MPYLPDSIRHCASASAIMPLCALLLVLFGLAILRMPLLAQSENLRSLGIYSDWAAFADADKQSCYAIAEPEDFLSPRNNRSYLSISWWRNHQTNGQIYALISRRPAKDEPIWLSLGGQRFQMINQGGKLWARNPQMDRQIAGLLRQGGVARLRSKDAGGQQISDRYALKGIASAMDAARLACLR